MFARALLRWLPIGVAATLVIGVSYVFAQQIYRQGANDPQVMVAHDTAAALAAGSEPDQLVSNETIDPSLSLAPFVIVFDATGRPLVSSARLAGATPVPPAGVLDASKATGENKVTWQPRSDTRIAAVVAAVRGGTGGFVLAGRSLRVVEGRVQALTSMAILGWATTMLVTFAATLSVGWIRGRRSGPEAA